VQSVGVTQRPSEAGDPNHTFAAARKESSLDVATAATRPFYRAPAPITVSARFVKGVAASARLLCADE
jgi:hypothetical protein